MRNYLANLLLVLLNVKMFCHSVQSLAPNCNKLVNDKLDFHALSNSIIPPLQGKRKGDNGKIAVIGGSVEYTGAPYFAAISALKVGADLVYIVTIPDAAPVIKNYSPELIVYPFLNKEHDLAPILKKMDVIVIGPGLGRSAEVLESFQSIISICRSLKKHLIIDADGLYAISINVTSLLEYPSAILTPNYSEAKHLRKAVSEQQGYEGNWFEYWGPGVTILEKGEEDEFHSRSDALNWKISKGGSARRAGGQGDILAGALGTFYNWALKLDICEDDDEVQKLQLKQAVASYVAATFTRKCSEKAFIKHGRSMTASDMLIEIHPAFTDLYGS